MKYCQSNRTPVVMGCAVREDGLTVQGAIFIAYGSNESRRLGQCQPFCLLHAFSFQLLIMEEVNLT